MTNAQTRSRGALISVDPENCTGAEDRRALPRPPRDEAHPQRIGDGELDRTVDVRHEPLVEQLPHPAILGRAWCDPRLAPDERLDLLAARPAPPAGLDHGHAGLAPACPEQVDEGGQRRERDSRLPMDR